MKIIISAALFTIIGLATGHFIATGFVGEYENNRSGYHKSYPSQEIWACYGGGAAGGLAIGLVIGGIAVLVDRRTTPQQLKP